jgi:hypothetical protein
LGELTRIGTSILKGYNPGVEVALAMTDWLRELGGIEEQQTTEFKTTVEVGGQTEQGRLLLRSLLLAHKILGPTYVKAGLVNQTQYDEFIRVIYQELTPQHVGQLAFNTVIAKKPMI